MRLTRFALKSRSQLGRVLASPRIASTDIPLTVNKMDEGRRKELDAKIRKLKTKSSQWASLPIVEKISLLEQVSN